MSDDYLEKKIKLMKIMYVLTIIVAGMIGLAWLIAPAETADAFGFPAHMEKLMTGVASSAFFAFAVMSVLGLRAPLRFAPVLLMQLTYKVTWFVAIILPLAIDNDLPDNALVMIVIFAIFIIGDLVSLPFKTLCSGEDVKR